MSRKFPYNIALLHYSCPPVVGGVEEIVRQQASLFQRNFHGVKVLAGQGGPSTDYRVEINPLLSSRHPEILELHRRLAQGDRPRDLRAWGRRVLEYLRGTLEGFDVLIAHNVLSMPFNLPLTWALHQLARLGSPAVVGWNHDSPYFYRGYPAYLRHPPWDLLRRRSSHIRYVVISETRRRQFGRLYGSRRDIRVIPNGIDPIAFFQLDPTTVRLIQEQRLFEGDFLMVQPSRLHPRKNIELSIRVTRALRERGLRARLLVTGAYDPHQPEARDYYLKLRQLARTLEVEEDVLVMAEYVFRSGERLSHDRITIRDLYLIADLLFLPSRQEGFGIPLLEAAMVKLPVVCADIPPFREIGREDVCFFSLGESPQVIAGKILAFLDTLQRPRFFRRVIRDYTWDNLYRSRLLPFLEDLLGRDSAGGS